MSRKVVLLVTALVLCTLAGAAGYWAAHVLPRAESQASNSAGLMVEGPSDVVIDRADRVTPLEYVFKLHNPTTESIVVKDVRCGCTCMASELPSRNIPPGSTVPLKVVVRGFPGFKATYRERIVVEANSGSLELSIGGKLPLPEHSVYRPDVLYMDVNKGDSRVEREVALRVPKQYCAALSEQQIKWTGSQAVSIRLVEDAPSEMYREFRLLVQVAADQAHTASGEIELDSGCGPVRVSVRPATRSSP